MRGVLLVLMLFCVNIGHAETDLGAALENTRAACGGIGNALDDMKTKAGINTAITGVGTIAGGVALGTGLAKVGVDKEIADLEKQIAELKYGKTNIPVEKLEIANRVAFDNELADFVKTYVAEIDKKQSEVSLAEQKSKNLGNWRTGMLATSTATNIAGAVVAGTNKVRGDLKSQINECLASVKTLSAVRAQARMDGTSNDAELARAERIISACDAWATVDIDAINKKSAGATVSAGLGAGLGIAGTVTSVSANSKSVRDGDAEKEKNLNTAANVLAGATTAASATATIFNATQISAIKRAATVADECEEALR